MVPATFVIIDSHLTEEVQRLVITEEDRARMREEWEYPDVLVQALRGFPWPGTATSWADLDRTQIQAFVATHITLLIEEPDYARTLAIGLHRAITALIVRIEEETGWVTTMRVRHLGSLYLEVDVALVIGVKIEPIEKPKTRFRVVVNNSGPNGD